MRRFAARTFSLNRLTIAQPPPTFSFHALHPSMYVCATRSFTFCPTNLPPVASTIVSGNIPETVGGAPELPSNDNPKLRTQQSAQSKAAKSAQCKKQKKKPVAPRKSIKPKSKGTKSKVAPSLKTKATAKKSPKSKKVSRKK
mmetsp:Transcript_22977/g.26671  ORF Transcript_22977/g.26671 Transcript_22977/m.26671 type:complete len:142 (+) Transcript_22977:73-498(+)